MAHTTVAQRTEHEELVKGSRFLAVVAPVASVEEARALVRALRAEHPDATHHCSAWRIGSEMASDDDGEPGGTAGRPMLGVLLKRELDHLATVCMRWFGGTKLGAGGLVRAYSGTVAKALDAAGERTVYDTVRAVAHAPFARVDAVLRMLDGWPGAQRGEPAYDAVGMTLPVRLLADDATALADAIGDATAGDARLEVEDPGD